VLVHEDASVDLKASTLGELYSGPYADTDDHAIVTHMPGEHASIGNIAERDAPPEIWPLRLRLLCGHGDLLTFCRKLSVWMRPRLIIKCRP
jgi:hypothetical protein